MKDENPEFSRFLFVKSLSTQLPQNKNARLSTLRFCMITRINIRLR